MNKELKQMLKFTSLVMLILLVMINLGGLIKRPPKELTANYVSWRINDNRLNAQSMDGSSEKGSYPSIKSHQALSLVAIKKQHKLYLMHNRQVLYIFNADINMKARHQLTAGELRGTSIYYQTNDNKSIVAHDWLGINNGGNIESKVRRDQRIDNTIELSAADAEWMYKKLPKSVSLTIY